MNVTGIVTWERNMYEDTEATQRLFIVVIVVVHSVIFRTALMLVVVGIQQTV